MKECWEARIATVVLGAVMASPFNAGAVDDALYYAIGGGEPITRSATTRNTTFSIGADLGWNVGSGVCSDFDPGLSVSNQLEGVQGSFQDLMSGVIRAATGAVASLPAMVIQRANPALYDLLQNGILQANEEFQLARASCEDMVGRMGEVMGSGDWRSIARGTRWGTEAGSGSEILEAKQASTNEAGDDGLIWAGGEKKGGDGQESIKVVGDTVKAGYNIALQRDPTDESGVLPAACDGSAICHTWSEPAAMAEWVTQVVGEKEIQTCEDCPPAHVKAGLGLSREVAREAETIESGLELLVAATDPPTLDELVALSGGPGMQLTRNVVEALREEGASEQGMIQKRLAAEMALARVMEKAMLARRALLAGRSEPNIEQNEKAQAELGKTVAELEREIDDLLFEMEIRQRVATNTAAALVGRALARQHVPMAEPRGSARFENGAISSE